MQNLRSVKNWKNVINYIDRAQIVYNNIIEAEKSERISFMNSDIARINHRHAYDLLWIDYQATFGH